MSFGGEERELLRALRASDEPSAEDRARVGARLEAELAVALGVGGVTAGLVWGASGSGGLVEGAALGVESVMAGAGAVGGVGAAALGAGAAGGATTAVVGTMNAGFLMTWGLATVLLGGLGFWAESWAQKHAPPAEAVQVSGANFAAAPLSSPEVVPSPSPPATEALAAGSSGEAEVAPVVDEIAAAPQTSVTAPSGRADGQLGSPAGVVPGLRAPAAPRAGSANDLEGEMRLISEAQKALGQGAPARASSLLDEHAALYPRGTFAVERSGLTAIALCQAGRGVEGKSRAQRFVTRHPNSPLVQRVRSSCGLDREP